MKFLDCKPNKYFGSVKCGMAENLARANDGMWEEALNFLDSFCFVFLIKEKNESPSGRTKMILLMLTINNLYERINMDFEYDQKEELVRVPELLETAIHSIRTANLIK